MAMVVSAQTCLDAGPPSLEMLFKDKTHSTILGCEMPASCPHFAEVLRSPSAFVHVCVKNARHMLIRDYY